jgi:hypothetical protein
MPEMKDDSSSKENSEDLQQFQHIVRGCLEQRSEISKVTDLLSESESPAVRVAIEQGDKTIAEVFRPLICILQFPSRLQELELYEASAERFVIALNGVLVFYGAVFPKNKPAQADFPSVRERVIEILQKNCNVKVVPPNIALGELCVFNKGIKPTSDQGDYAVPVHLARRVTLRDAMRFVYKRFRGILTSFYLLNLTVEESDDAVRSIRLQERDLLVSLRDLLSTRAINVFKRRRIANAIQLGTTALLELLSTNASFSSRLGNEQLQFKKELMSDGVAISLLGKSHWDECVTGQTVDKDSLLALVQHVQSETQTSRIVSVTVWAAIVGSIVGALVYAVLALVTPIVAGLLR